MLNVGFFFFKKEEGRERKMESQTGCILWSCWAIFVKRIFQTGFVLVGMQQNQFSWSWPLKKK